MTPKDIRLANPILGNLMLAGAAANADQLIATALFPRLPTALRGFQLAHPVVLAALFELDRATAAALLAVGLDRSDGDSVAMLADGHGGLRGEAGEWPP